MTSLFILKTLLDLGGGGVKTMKSNYASASQDISNYLLEYHLPTQNAAEVQATKTDLSFFHFSTPS